MTNEHGTDVGNARRLRQHHARDLRYCAPLRRWYAWDGRRWEADATGEVMRRAKDTVRGMLREAVDLPNDTDGETAMRKAAIKWALSSESRYRLEAMIRLAESERPIPILPEELDAAPWLLNCQNGTVDLRTGVFTDHRREDLITRITPIAYEPEAWDDRWTQFVEQVMPDDNVRRYVQRALGYSITGTGVEGGLFLPFGPTHTGKTTLLEAVAAALGDYSVPMDVDTLVGDPRHRDGGRARPDLVRLFNARLVVSTEVPEGARLDAALVKKLTGGDSLWARTGYEFNGRTSEGTFVIWLGSNHRPHVRDSDDAVWERVRQIPFDQQHVGNARDKSLRPHLKTEARVAVLAWLIEGARAYVDQGLEAPQAVVTLTEDYRREMNPLTRWVEECCDIGAGHESLGAALRASYEEFTPLRERVGSRRYLNSLANLAGVTYDKDRRVWHGIRVAEHPEDLQDRPLTHDERVVFSKLAEDL